MEPLTTQYVSYNQRRLHYSLLFWACLALHFSATLIVVFFLDNQTVFKASTLLGLVSLSSFLMAFIAYRLHRLEVHYENLLRKIEEHWTSQNIGGIQQADITGKVSSRKLVVLAMIGLACVFFWLAITQA